MAEEKAKLTHEHNFYSLAYPNGIRVSFDRVRESSGRLRADMVVESIPTQNKPVFRFAGPVDVALKGVSDIPRIIKDLETHDLSPAETRPWREMINKAVSIVVQEFQKGEPFVDLTKLPTPVAGQQLITGFIPQGHISVLTADGGTLKSTLAIATCLTVMTGKSVIPGFGISKNINGEYNTGSCLYLDYESSQDDIHLRLFSLASGAGVEFPTDNHFIYRPMWSPLASIDRRPLREVIIEEKIKFIVVDSVGYAAGAELEKAEAATGMYNALRELSKLTGATVLCIAHVSKAIADNPGRRRSFGSVYFENGARCVWEIRRIIDENEDDLSDDDNEPVRLELYNTKNNNARIYKHPVNLEVCFSGPGQPSEIARSNFSSNLDISPDSLNLGLSTQQRIEDLLKYGPLPLYKLAELVRKTPEETARICTRMGNRLSLSDEEWIDTATGEKSFSVYKLNEG